MQPKKKIVSLDEGQDPLSSLMGANPVRKSVQKKNFENAILQQERELLGGDRTSEKRPESAINKPMPGNVSSKDTSPTPALVKNPFGSSPPHVNTNEKEQKSQSPIKAEHPVHSSSDKSPAAPGNNARLGRNPFDGTKNAEYLKTTNNLEEKSPLVARPRSPAMRPASLKLLLDDLLPGEQIVASIGCWIMLMQYPDLSGDGVFIITNYKVIFKPNDEKFLDRRALKKDYLTIPLMFIYKIDKSNDKRSMDLVYIDIYSKDGRIIKLKIPEKQYNDANSLLSYLLVYAYPEKKQQFFAFEFGKHNKELEEKYKGWKIYDIEKEFKRQGIDLESSTEPHAFRFVDNRNFKICATYPPKLLIPAKVSDQAFLASSRFRTKERVPCVTYYYAKKGTILSRSSQSKPGIYQNRCFEDEQLLRYLGNPYLNDIGDTGVTEVNLSIYDARPYLNAMANKVNGKGFEDTKCYRNCEINFMNIDNIHHVRDGHKKLLTLCYSPEMFNNKWYSQLESSNWLEYISFILDASNQITNSMRKGKNVLVHCSDGWDRTSQMLALAQIMLDPYYRTIEGFEVLVMKDFVYFGHQFNLRTGHGNRNEKDDQKSPVFLQFLDCVHQLMHQYPFAFEFNDRFLVDLAYHSYSCQFGTFLCNSYQEITLYKMEENTVSVWSYLNSQKEKYYNTYYNKHQDPHNPLVLRVSRHLKHLRLWEEYFLNFSWLSKPHFNLHDNIVFPNDFYEHVLLKERKKMKELKSEMEELKAKLKAYESQEEAQKAEKSPEKSDEDQKEDDEIIIDEEDVAFNTNQNAGIVEVLDAEENCSGEDVNNVEKIKDVNQEQIV